MTAIALEYRTESFTGTVGINPGYGHDNHRGGVSPRVRGGLPELRETGAGRDRRRVRGHRGDPLSPGTEVGGVMVMSGRLLGLTLYGQGPHGHPAFPFAVLRPL